MSETRDVADLHIPGQDSLGKSGQIGLGWLAGQVHVIVRGAPRLGYIGSAVRLAPTKGVAIPAAEMRMLESYLSAATRQYKSDQIDAGELEERVTNALQRTLDAL